MKNWVLCISFVISPLIYGAPCSGALGKIHKNPDNTLGGFVANTAMVMPTVFLDVSSSVCEQAKVQGKVKIKSGSWIAGSASLEGNSEIYSSRIYGVAKVYGTAQIVNSSVCQASDINFKVSNSDYYCQTDDAEPKDPGELGKKTIVGIDSDADGVRDDVEIWINNATTNLPGKDNYNKRMALKQIALQMRKVHMVKENESLLPSEFANQQLAQDCYFDIVGNDSSLLSSLAQQTFNTIERLDSHVELKSKLAGKVVYEASNKIKYASCNFKLR